VESWETWKFQLGTGRFRNYQCAAADAATLQNLAAATSFVLTGTGDPGLEVQAQLSDDSGHTWMVYRRGATTRIHRDGEALPETTGEASLASALLDLDDTGTTGGSPGDTQATTVTSWKIVADGAALALAPFEDGPSARSLIQDATAAQIAVIAQGCAEALAAPSLSDPAMIVRLARRLEPLYHQLRELALQAKELNALVGPQGGVIEAAVERLTVEVDLSTQVAEAAEPLLAPGVSLKALREELAKVEAQLGETTTALGLDEANAASAPGRDFRKAFEVLSRLEAQARLVRASQAARTWCERHVEPLYRKYLDLGDEGLARDRQIAAELESCLATLSLRVPSFRGPDAGPAARTPHTEPDAASHTDKGGLPPGLHSLRNWFDRWKVRQRADEDPAAGPGAAEANAAEGLETERLAVEYALARLTELSESTRSARRRHESALAVLDRAHEEATRDYGKLRDRWLEIAPQMRLPTELDVNGLVQIAEAHGRLVSLAERRTHLTERINDLTQRFARLERLVADWRRASGSQKVVDLSHPQLLLTEARDIIRYKDQRQKRLAQAKATVEAARMADAHRQVLKKRKAALLADWQGAVKAANAGALDAMHPKLPELFRQATALRGLALVRAATASRAQDERLFDVSTEQSAACVYLWGEAQTSNEQRLALLSELEVAKGGELRLLLVADTALAALLAPLGVGMATRLPPTPTAAQQQPQPRPQTGIPKVDPQVRPRVLATEARPTPTLPGPRAASAKPQAAPQIGGGVAGPSPAVTTRPELSEKAKRTLDLLKTNRIILK
jgi:hypothetical protein